MTEGVDDSASTNAGIRNHAVGAYAYIISQRDLAFKNTVHVNRNIGSALQDTAHVQARRVRQAHTLFHQFQGGPPLTGALQFSQLQWAVDTSHLQGIGDLVRHHLNTIGDRKFHDAGQVILALCVVAVKPRQPLLELPGGQGHHAAVNLVDGTLLGTGVFLLDDGLHRLATTLDAAVAGRIGKVNRQQGQLVASTGGNQLLQSIGAYQGHVARQDHDDAIVAQHRQDLLHRVAGTQLKLLTHEVEIKGSGATALTSQRGLHFGGAMTGNHDHLPRRKLGRSIHNMLEQSASGQKVQHFRQFAFHARAFAGRHDHHIHSAWRGGVF